MKTLDVLGTGIKKAKAAMGAVAQAVRPRARATGDPFYSDRERRDELEGRDRWLGPRRRRGWLR